MDTIGLVYTTFDKLNAKYIQKLDDLSNKIESLGESTGKSYIKHYEKIMSFSIEKMVNFFKDVKEKFKELISRS
jgi:DNA-binding ferritin-like protein